MDGRNFQHCYGSKQYFSSASKADMFGSRVCSYLEQYIDKQFSKHRDLINIGDIPDFGDVNPGKRDKRMLRDVFIEKMRSNFIILQRVLSFNGFQKPDFRMPRIFWSNSRNWFLLCDKSSEVQYSNRYFWIGTRVIAIRDIICSQSMLSMTTF